MYLAGPAAGMDRWGCDGAHVYDGAGTCNHTHVYDGTCCLGWEVGLRGLIVKTASQGRHLLSCPAPIQTGGRGKGNIQGKYCDPSTVYPSNDTTAGNPGEGTDWTHVEGMDCIVEGLYCIV